MRPRASSPTSPSAPFSSGCGPGLGAVVGVVLGPGVAGLALVDAAGVGLGVAVADSDATGELATVGDGDTGVGDGVAGVAEAVGDGVTAVGLGETQFGSIVKRTARCSMYSSKCTTRQYMTYDPGASAGMSVRRIRVQV